MKIWLIIFTFGEVAAISFPPHQTMDDCQALVSRYSARLEQALADAPVIRGRVVTRADVVFACVGQEDGLAGEVR